MIIKGHILVNLWQFEDNPLPIPLPLNRQNSKRILCTGRVRNKYLKQALTNELRENLRVEKLRE